MSEDHFLKKLNEIIDWTRFTRKLLKGYKGKGKIGQAPCNKIIEGHFVTHALGLIIVSAYDSFIAKDSNDQQNHGRAQ